MSDSTAFNAAAMQEGIQSFTAAHRSLTEHLDTLDGQLQGSLAQWDGPVRSAYSTAKATWDQAARHMQEVIQKFGQVLSPIAAYEDSTEDKIQSSWS